MFSYHNSFLTFIFLQTVNLVKDVFTCISERDIYTGDNAEIFVITKDGIKKEVFKLRAD